MAETDFAISQRRWRENCTLRNKVEDLKRQLAEAIEIAENAIEKWGDVADSYGVYFDDIALEEIKLKQLKEKG